MFSRRNLMGTGLAAAAVATCAPHAFALPGDKIKYATSGHQFIPMLPHPEEGIKMTAYYGYHGIEPFDDETRKFRDKGQDFKVLKDRLDAVGLQLCTIGSGGEYLDTTKFQDTLKSNLDNARYVKQFGCNHLKVNLSRRPSNDRDMTPAELKVIAGHINEIGKQMADVGVRFAFHPHCWTVCERTAELDYLMQNTDPRYVWLTLDPGHATLGGIDPLRVMDIYYSRVAALHLKDAEAKYNVRKAGWKGPAPSPEEHRRVNLYKRMGAGGVDFPAIFKILRDKKWTGWATLDFSAELGIKGSVQDDMNRHKKYLLDVLKADLKHI